MVGLLSMGLFLPFFLALFKAVETMGDKNASIQVNPWIRAVVVRVGETDHISFRKSLRDEAAKELTEALRVEAANESTNA